MGLIKAAMGAAGGVMAVQEQDLPIQKEVTTLLVTVPELQ